MKILATFLITSIVLAAIIVPQTIVIIDETELAVITRFGDPLRTIRTPGLYVKVPIMDTAVKFDKRLLIFDAPTEGLLTEDKKTLLIDVFARGRISDPLLFYQRIGSVSQAQDRVISIVGSELRREIALDLQHEVIQEAREPIMNRVRDAARPAVAEMGIDIIDVRIKRADFPESIAGSVYERMKAERQRIADRERAQGAEAELQKKAEVDREAVEILSTAQRDAQIIRGQAEADAIRIFADALERDPELYRFLRPLESYRLFLNSNTTLVLPLDSDLFEFLETPFPEPKLGPDAQPAPGLQGAQ